MLAGIDFTQAFTFPFKDMLSRRYFIYGSAIALAGFIIPVLPHLILLGYASILIKQVLNNETLQMPEWNNLGELLKSGARIFAVRLVYIIPFFILGIPFFASIIAMPLAAEIESEGLFIASMVILLAGSCLMTPLSLVVAAIVPIAELYAVENESFAAALRISEWWKILRANIGGVIAAVAVVYLFTLVLTFVTQIMVATLVLACLLPFVIPAATMYLTLVTYVTFAQAYKAGKGKLAGTEIYPIISNN